MRTDSWVTSAVPGLCPRFADFVSQDFSLYCRYQAVSMCKLIPAPIGKKLAKIKCIIFPPSELALLTFRSFGYDSQHLGVQTNGFL